MNRGDDMTFEQQEVIKFLERKAKWERWEKQNNHMKTMANWGMAFFGMLMTLIIIDILDKVG
jgi:hypothetical protein